MGDKKSYYHNFEKDNRESRTFEQVRQAYDKLQDILNNNASKVFITGGIVPYLLLNRDSGRLHDDIDAVCSMPDVSMLREIFKNTPYYKEEWDSINYAKDGIDYGFELMIDDVPVGIATFEHKDGMLIAYSFDPYTKQLKFHEMHVDDLSDYFTKYEGKDGRTYYTTTLEYIKKSKDMVKRPKDIADSKIIEEIGYSQEIYNRIVTPPIQFKKDGKNAVQSYLDELNKIEIPNDEKNILNFLSSLDGDLQKCYLSFILSQSHIFDSMTAILDTYTHKDFYYTAGHSDRTGNVVPKLNTDGRVYYEEYTSSDDIDKACRTILKSLQGGDKSAWDKFVKYVKSIYEPNKMDIYQDPQLNQLNQDIINDFTILNGEIIENDYLREEISKLRNKPVSQGNGFINRIKGFFSQRKRDKKITKKEASLQDDSAFLKKALALIEKYKGNKNASNAMINQLQFAESLIKAGLPKEIFMNVLNGLGRSLENSSFCNYRIFNMLKQLSINASIAKELYSPEILYAPSFQDMTKNIRKLIAKRDLKENSPITTEYRTKPLRNALLASEDISNVLKGKNLSQKEIQAKMTEYDEEFKNILEEENAETYIKRCTDLMMKFISTHPFDDGNGRTARMLLQAMLARRGILLPSNIDNYFERQPGTNYSTMEDSCLRTEDYTQMENYIIARAKIFNNGKLVLNDEPLTFEFKDKQKTVEQLKSK